MTVDIKKSWFAVYNRKKLKRLKNLSRSYLQKRFILAGMLRTAKTYGIDIPEKMFEDTFKKGWLYGLQQKKIDAFILLIKDNGKTPSYQDKFDKLINITDIEMYLQQKVDKELKSNYNYYKKYGYIWF